jgi:hypothetical protein
VLLLLSSQASVFVLKIDDISTCLKVGAEVLSYSLERSQGYCLLSLSLFIGTQMKMTDLNTIRFIPFYGNVDEWPIWSERFEGKWIQLEG